MSKDPKGEEKRQYPRVPTDRTAAVSDGERRHKGRVTDISAGGAAVNLKSDIEDFDHSLEAGNFVEVEMEGLMPLQGHVARTIDDGIAIAFDIDDDEQEDLIDAIMSGNAGLDVGD